MEKGGELAIPVRFSDNVGITKVEYRLDRFVWTSVPCPLPCRSWNVTVPLGEMPSGNHQIEVRVSDAAGNTAVVTQIFSVVLPHEDGGLSTGVIAGIAGAMALVVLVALFMLHRMRGAEERPPEEEPPQDVPEEPGSRGGEGDGDVEADEGEGPPPQEDVTDEGRGSP